MDAEDIIYIVVTIVIFVVSLLGKTKKNAPPVPEIEDGEEYSLNEFEKLLIRKQELAEALQDQDMEQAEADDLDYVEQKNIEDKKETSLDKTPVEEEEYEDGFDVKSAVIYSSILERKKFRH